MDISTILGLVIGIGGIIIGNAVEGGHIGSLTQATAAFIVFGGTLGATFVANTWNDIRSGVRQLGAAFGSSGSDQREYILQQTMEFARIARKESLLSIERLIPRLHNEFMKSVFRFVVDGVDAKNLRDVFEKEVELIADQKKRGAKVWQDAGGFAPTIGIIGAVLGLIHVMANLTDTSQLGKGIAVAFVATIYGVGSANLIFLPIANKIRRKSDEEADTHRMILEGALSILRGQNAYLIDEKLGAYVSPLHREPTRLEKLHKPTEPPPPAAP